MGKAEVEGLIWMMKDSFPFAVPLEILRKEIAAGDLLPEEYARYRPLLADGLCFFLERLPTARLMAIFAEQSPLPRSTRLAERVVLLLHHVPTLHKLGQVLARDRRVAPGFRKYLQKLESLEPRTSLTEVVSLLRREFPGFEKAGIKLGPQPLAEGSVAIILPFSAGQSCGVFKLLKAGIAQRLDQELAIWSRLGEFLDEDCRRYHLPPLNYQETFETVRDLLVNEVRLDQEQKHLAQASKDYAGMHSVVIPGLLPFCTPGMTAMERIEGEPLTNHLEDAAPQKGFAHVIARALIAHPIFSPSAAPLFHADPHAGNLFVTTDGRLAILDWSLIGKLQRDVRAQLMQILLGGVSQDPQRILAALRKLDRQISDTAALHKIIDDSLRELRWGTMPGIGWLTRFLDQIVIQGGVRLESDLLLFRKMMLTLEGVIGDVCGDASVGIGILDAFLLVSFTRHFIEEWPERVFQPPLVRRVTTQISNADLFELAWGVPAIFTRYWALEWAHILSHFLLVKRRVIW
jgi:ubiquinone biosynthesis protein